MARTIHDAPPRFLGAPQAGERLLSLPVIPAIQMTDETGEPVSGKKAQAFLFDEVYFLEHCGWSLPGGDSMPDDAGATISEEDLLNTEFWVAHPFAFKCLKNLLHAYKSTPLREAFPRSNLNGRLTWWQMSLSRSRCTSRKASAACLGKAASSCFLFATNTSGELKHR